MTDDRDQVGMDVAINAPIASVWSAWTTSQGAQTFFAENANIDLRIGGPYEIFFNSADDRMSTKELAQRLNREPTE